MDLLICDVASSLLDSTGFKRMNGTTRSILLAAAMIGANRLASATTVKMNHRRMEALRAVPFLLDNIDTRIAMLNMDAFRTKEDNVTNQIDNTLGEYRKAIRDAIPKPIITIAVVAANSPVKRAMRNRVLVRGVVSMYCRTPDSRSSTMLVAARGRDRRGIKGNETLMMTVMN